MNAPCPRAPGAALVALALATVALTACHGRSDAPRRALPRLTAPSRPAPPPTTTPTPPPPPRPPDGTTELELVRGADHTDLVADEVPDGDGALVIHRTPTWTYASELLSTTFPSNVRAVARPTGVRLIVDNACLDVVLDAPHGSLAEARRRPVETHDGWVAPTGTGRVTIAGVEVPTARYQLGAWRAERVVRRAGSGREWHALLVWSDDADTTPLLAALADLTIGPRTAGPELTVERRDAGGAVIARTEARLDVPFVLAGRTYTVARRPTVRHVARDLAFEYPPELWLARSWRATVVVATTAIAFTPVRQRLTDLARGWRHRLRQPVTDTLSLGDGDYPAYGGDLRDDPAQHLEAYQARGGDEPWVLVAATPTRFVATARALAAPIMASLR